MNIDPDKVPATIEESVKTLVASLSEEDVKYIKTLENHYSCHFSAGMAIRNNWSLWSPDSPLKRDAVDKYKIAHADDISGLMFAWVWALVREEPFDPLKHVEVYHTHWKNYHTTSLEAGGWHEV